MRQLLNTIFKVPAPGFVIEENGGGYYRARLASGPSGWMTTDPYKSIRKAVFHSWENYDYLKLFNEVNEKIKLKNQGGWKEI